MLNIRAGDGSQLLMISDEAATIGDDVLVTDQTVRALARDEALPAAHAETTTHPSVPQNRIQFADTDTEIYVVGLAEGAITFSTSLGTKGDFADGITIWAGWGADDFVDGSHLRAGVRTITTINTGLGDDDVIANLTAGRGRLLRPQHAGPVRQPPRPLRQGHRRRDGSTLPLVIFGGQDDDTIHGGTGGDLVFGDRGRVLYFDPALGTPTSAMTQAQLEALAGTCSATAGPGDRTDGVLRLAGYAIERRHAGRRRRHDRHRLGRDVVVGGVDDDEITTNRGETAGTPDAGGIVIGDNGFVDWALLDNAPADIDRIWSIDPDTGGTDTITTGNGDDVVIAGEDGEPSSRTTASRPCTSSRRRQRRRRHDRRRQRPQPRVRRQRQDHRAVSDASRFGSLPLTLGLVETIESLIGGSDSITTGSGDDVILGGINGDTINAGDGNNLVVGDSGLVDWTAAERGGALAGDDTNPADVDRIARRAPTTAAAT